MSRLEESRAGPRSRERERRDTRSKERERERERDRFDIRRPPARLLRLLSLLWSSLPLELFTGGVDLELPLLLLLFATFSLAAALS